MFFVAAFFAVITLPVEFDASNRAIKLLVRQGTAAGVFAEAELDMVSRVLAMDRRRVSSLMTPRPEVKWLDLSDTPTQVRDKLAESSFSRYPLCDGSLDKLVDDALNDTQMLTACRSPSYDEMRRLFLYAYDGQPIDF